MPADAPAERPVRKPTTTNVKERSAAQSLRRHEITTTAYLCALVVIIGYVDYVSGPEIGFSLFYLAPVVAAGWYVGRGSAVTVALAAAICWFTADYLIRVSLGLSLWNGLTRLVIYTGQGILIATLREDRRREAVLARTDAVTELPNSRSFYESIEARVKEQAPITAMFIDLDNFKRVNDLFGHPTGDEILKRVAGALRKAIRATDVAARVGGDEFAVLLQDIDEQACAAIGTRIIEGVRAIASDLEGTAFGASVGIAISREGRTSSKDLVKAADAALYEAKERQKGTYVIRVL
jgi:diguanylate cyclase (GGDEF)-like protein